MAHMKLLLGVQAIGSSLHLWVVRTSVPDLVSRPNIPKQRVQAVSRPLFWAFWRSRYSMLILICIFVKLTALRCPVSKDQRSGLAKAKADISQKAPFSADRGVQELLSFGNLGQPRGHFATLQ